MTILPKCPQCNSEYAYEDGAMYICPECSHEWSKFENKGLQELLSQTDKALYKAKNSGRNRVCIGEEFVKKA